jgi:CheY-like chemotaxis protein
VKRGRKTNNPGGDDMDKTSSISPWAGWCWLNPSDGESQEITTILNEFGELGWVRQQIARVIDTIDLDVPSSERVMSEAPVESLSLKTEAKSTSPRLWIPSTAPRTIYLASSNRSDPIEQIASAFEKRYPEASVQIVLGEWWTGHRRTWPLAAKWMSAYWYQCCDIVLPKLLSENKDRHIKSSSTSKLAFVLSEDSSIRHMWLEVLLQLGFQAVAASQRQGLPEGNVDVVVYDSRDDDSLSEVELLRRTYPDAKIAVFCGFPNWNQAKRCLDAGADGILGKPFQMEGFQSLLSDWTSEH